MKFIDNFLNKITMYRLVLYYLLALFLVAVVLGFFGVIGYGPLELVYSVFFIMLVCLLANELFARFFKVPANVESVYITALILVFLVTPPQNFSDTTFLSVAFWISLLAIASKYIITWKRKHIFNPAALGAMAVFFLLGQSVVWWVGTASLAIPVAIGGFLTVRKIRRWDLVLSFMIVAVLGIVVSHLGGSLSVWSVVKRIFVDTSIMFFAFVMLTEPLTTPPTKNLRIVYGVLTGVFFSGLLNIGPLHFSPEMALLVGNIFSYIVSPKARLPLKLSKKIKVANDTYDFVFDIPKNEKFSFKPGQYMEWTISPKGADTRGNRRYFTIASSPTEDQSRIGVKFYTNGSTFKNNLWDMKEGDMIYASGLAGDFSLPKDGKRKLVFLAGGIGVTPFRSIAKYISDKNEKRDIFMIYSARTVDDIAYREVFDEAQKVGMKSLYVVGENPGQASPDMRVGMITGEMIKKEIPDFAERVFYISGPHSMVTAFEKTLKEMGVKKTDIKVDYFPGFV